MEDYVKILSDLVAFDTESSDLAEFDKSNFELIKYARSFFENLGFSVETTEVNTGKYNLIASFGDKNGGLLLSGHTDTVPCDKALWQSDPFILTQKGSRLYGLGSCDMKGFLALAMCFAKKVKSFKKSTPLHILMTADEETSMIGASSFIKSNSVNPDVVIIGEPTSLDCICTHKGYMARKVTIKGRSCHSSDPKSGINAIKIAGEVIEELNRFEDRLKQYQDKRFSVTYPTLNIGVIKGGDSVNRVCPFAEILFDVRPTSMFDADKVNQELQLIKNKLNEKYSGAIDIMELYPDIDPFDNNNEEVLALFKQVTGKDGIGVNYCTEASFLNKIGDVVVMGAGDIANAHQIDEYIDLNEAYKCYDIITKIYNLL